MRVLYITDRISVCGGADQHLLQLISAMAETGEQVTVAFGRRQSQTELAHGAQCQRVPGLTARVATGAGLDGLTDLVQRHQVVHIQNVMNPTALNLATSASPSLVTVQDHRVLCPGPGKTLPDGTLCRRPMSETVCTECLPDREYRESMIRLTRDRRNALRNARLVVLSRYMAKELAAVGLDQAEVLPPWVECGPPRSSAGDGFLLAGRLVRHKGPVQAWRAWREAATGHPLRVAGAGPLTTRLSGAEHLGWLSQDQLRRQIRRARALIFPCRWQEPFGILGVQALAEGTPVVVADRGGTREWSGKGCIRVAPGDISAMIAAISRLAGDTRLAMTLGREGQAMVARRFARGQVEPRLRDLYREVQMTPP